MGLVFSSFKIRGIDVSFFNGTIDWSKLVTIKPHFAAIRGGFGEVTDGEFKKNWQNSKGKVNRIVYWYMDYYSNHTKGWAVYGVSDEEWGRRQAEACWNTMKSDPEGIVFLDIENGNSAYAPKLSTVASSAQTIARAFLQRMDELNGKTNGIYCSLGLLTWFGGWFRDRPLWVAWYNEAQTITSVKSQVRATGWTGRILIWQYASHGCTNGDGIPQGKNLGTELKQLDLNAWTGTELDYSALFGKPVVVVPEDEVPTHAEPVEPPVVVITDYTRCRVTARLGLSIRALPTTNSDLLGYYLFNKPVFIGKEVNQGIGSVQGWAEIPSGGYMSLDWLKKE